MKKTSVYLTEEEAESLRALSRATGRSQAELIRDGIRSLLGHKPERAFRSLGMGASGAGRARRWDADELMARRTGRR